MENLPAQLAMICGVLFLLWCLIPARKQPARKTETHAKSGEIRTDGRIQVGEAVLTPGEAKKAGIKISGFYEAKKKTRKYWKAWD